MEKIDEKEQKPTVEQMIDQKISDSVDGSFYLNDKEKLDSDSRALLGDWYIGSEWFDVSDEIIAGENDPKDDLLGLNLDMKL